MDKLEEPPCAGVVKWFDSAKGYGFIRVASGSQDGHEAFVHYTAIKMAGRKVLLEGQEVTMNLARCEKGLFAESVTSSTS